MPAFNVNPASKPALMDVRARAPRQKTAVPGGRSPSVFYLASGPDFSRTDITRQAMKPARQKRKQNMSSNTNQSQAAEPRTPPVAKVRIGLITASIWENKTDKGTFHNVTFERRYKDGDQWKSSHSYNTGDLLELAKAADLAHTKILELTAKAE
jgi:hypothetical protein